MKTDPTAKGDQVMDVQTLSMDKDQARDVMKVAINEKGNVYGRLTVLIRDGSISNTAAWKCRCECGRTIRVRGMTSELDTRDRADAYGQKPLQKMVFARTA
jgi:hypothetical protein